MEAWANSPLTIMGTFVVSALCILLNAGCDVSTCRTDADCPDDGIFCNGVVSCLPDNDIFTPQTLDCRTIKPCEDTDFVCDEATRSCLPCTLDEQCDDGIACTDDTCDVGSGRCSNDYNDSNCQMGYLCGSEGCFLGECRSAGDCSALTPFCVLGPNGRRCVSDLPPCSASCAKQMPDG